MFDVATQMQKSNSSQQRAERKPLNPESARRIGFKARLPEILRQAAVFKVETRGLVPLGSSIIWHGN